MEVRELITRFGADTSELDAASQRITGNLKQLNKDFYENQQKLKAAQAEYKAMAKELAALEKSTSSFGLVHKDQQEHINALKDSMSRTALEIGRLKTNEQDLKDHIKASNAELKKHNEEIRGVSNQAHSAKNSISGLSTALKALMFGYTGKKLAEILFGSNAEMEQVTTSFEVMLGSAAKAEALMNRLRNDSMTPLLGWDTISQSTQKLLGYGVAAEDVVNKLRQFGDLAGGSAVKIDRISLAYGQMLAKGKVTGEELRQMTEAGVPLLQALADTMGITTAEVSKMVSAGSVGIEELDRAIESMTTGTGRFAGMMEKQSESMNGMLSTLKEYFNEFGRDVGGEAFGTLKDSIASLLRDIERMRETGDLGEITEDWGHSIGNLIEKFVTVVKVLWDYREVVMYGITAITAYKTATTVATVAQNLLNLAVNANPMAAFISILAGVTSGLGLLSFALSDTSSELSNSIQRVEELSQDLEDLESGGLGGAVRGMNELYNITENILPKIEELSEKTNRTAGENHLLQQYVATVNSALGYEAYQLDVVSGALSGNTAEIWKNVEALKAQAAQKAAGEKYAESLLLSETLRKETLEAERKAADAVSRANQSREQSVVVNPFKEIPLANEARKAQEELKAAREAEEKNKKNLELYNEFIEKNAEKAAEAAAQASTAAKSSYVISNEDYFKQLQLQRDTDLVGQNEYYQEVTKLATEAKTEVDRLMAVENRTAQQDNALQEALTSYRTYYSELEKMQKQSTSSASSSAKSSANAAKTAAKEAEAAAKAASKAAEAAAKEDAAALKKWLSDQQKAYNDFYNERKKSADKAYKQKVKEVDDDLALEEKRIQGLIDAIDAEIEARRRLQESKSLQAEMDEISGRLKYEQLDEFSRQELERRLARLQGEQSENEWQNQKADQKAALQNELAAAKEAAAYRKEQLAEEKEKREEMYEREKELMAETFDKLSENFTSLSELQQAGITTIGDIFLIAAANEQREVNTTFDLIKNGTLAVGDLYAKTVSKKIGEVFDYQIQRAKDAIRQLENAIDDAKSAARSTSRSTSTINSNNTTTASISISNNSLSASQIARSVTSALYDPIN